MSAFWIIVSGSALVGIVGACVSRSTRPSALAWVIAIPVAAVILWSIFQDRPPPKVSDDPRRIVGTLFIAFVAALTAAASWAVTYVIRSRISR